MTDPRHASKLSSISWVLIVAVVCLGGCLALDLVALRSAKPPSNVKTIEEFRAWAGDRVMGERSYEDSGSNYTVLLAPAGRTIASGSSGYVFDSNGNFIDWSSDIGDLKTKNFHFELGGGRLRKIEGGNAQND